ncbi:hypothetical protein G3I60_20180 [Streptomyces sp. SID13666]|uniref:hypothetical protein n=1 Tax=Streptomyces sp. SID13666 TaxID=2706054 RepID=UPI0013BF9A53|nr:hypothetical protein [Streptomyces sp. SID13666]NEA56400.1 hypothetical protein [Streptomyces sp. SID13666]
MTTRSVGSYSPGHISNIENGYTAPSSELVDYYITTFAADSQRLRAAYSSIKAESELRRRQHRNRSREVIEQPPVVTADSPKADIRATYRLTKREESFRIDGRGVIEELTAIITVVPTQATEPLYLAEYVYPTDRRHGVMSATAGMGCSLIRQNESDRGVLTFVLNLDESVVAADFSRAFSYKVQVNSTQSMEPTLWYHDLRELSWHGLRVQFTPSKLPRKIWWFRDVGMNAMNFDPDANQILPLNAAGFYFLDFHDLRDEISGIAWIWEA